MRIWLDTADIDEIAHWAKDDRISGFTTNPTLMKTYRDKGYATHQQGDALQWAKNAVAAADGKPISIDGPEAVWDLGDNVWRKMTGITLFEHPRVNVTGVCHKGQVPYAAPATCVISVFAGRIMDTGRDPQPIIDAARATGAQVLWASVREPYNIVQAEAAGCDIITVPPAILTKWFDWQGLPLETVAARTIAQFDKDREGLW